MNIKRIVTQITQVPVIFLLTMTGITLNPTPAISQQIRLTQEIIDDWTDEFFYRANPQLSGRQIRANETEYIREWNAIERIIPDLLVYNNNPVCGDRNWILESYDHLSVNEGKALVSDELNQVADAIFYARHPELSGRKIRSNETQLANEWLRIRSTVSLLHPCD